MHILGAGLSGLICGAINARSTIYERNGRDFITHRAVLRFRDDKIARALGLTFRRVTVRKGIWDGGEVRPSPRLANQYSQKVRSGTIAENSLWNLDPSERYIAPNNLHAILADICGDRVHWNAHVDAITLEQLPRPVISTIPLPLLLPLLQHPHIPDFKYSPITVDRYRIADCDVFQTIYFPDPRYSVYRATLTGDLLTVESTTSVEPELEEVLDAFGINDAKVERIEATHRQSFGKIAPIPDAQRKSLLHQLTVEHGIYSLGRFATWRNILLDDVYEDVFAIRKMMTLHSYDVTLERALQ